MAQEKTEAGEVASVHVREMKAVTSHTNSAHNKGRKILAIRPEEHCKYASYNNCTPRPIFKFLNCGGVI